jgi:hypothetical protein
MNSSDQMRRQVQGGRSGPFRAVAETVLGLALAAVPVALWVAWSPLVFGLVLGTCLVCAVLLVALTDAGSGGPEVPAPLGRGPLSAIPEAGVEELHGLYPLTYHHGRRRDPRFHAVMETLRRLTRG